MNSSRLACLIILASVLGFSACGGAAEKQGGDTKAAGDSPTAGAATPAPTAVGTNAVATNADAAPTVRASAAGAAAPPGTSPAPQSRATANAPSASSPKPQIGSGGNDLFLFTQARAAINGDADLKEANLIVEVKEGVVTLSGNVASAALKSKAEELARGAGAKDVKNQLRVSAAR